MGMATYIASAPTLSDTPWDVSLGRQDHPKSAVNAPPAYSAAPPPPPPPHPHPAGPSTQQQQPALADLPLSQRVDVVARQLDLEHELVTDLLSWVGTEVVLVVATPGP